MLGMGPAADYKTLISNGAMIVDVRTPAEYKGGHAKGSINIPLDQLSGNLKKIKKDKPVIVCCASGMRSGSAKKMLEAQGFEAYNAGPWTNLRGL